MTQELRQDVDTGIAGTEDEKKPRLTELLSYLGIGTSRWYYKAVSESERKQPLCVPVTVPRDIAAAVVKMAEDNPWYGYKRIAVMCRRDEVAVTNRQAYRVMKKNGLLHERKKAKPAELHQALKLYELLPQGPNELWQTDVTYIHIPGYGWHYAVTVIDYYSRYLLACHDPPREGVSRLKNQLGPPSRGGIEAAEPIAPPPGLPSIGFIPFKTTSRAAFDWFHSIHTPPEGVLIGFIPLNPLRLHRRCRISAAFFSAPARK